MKKSIMLIILSLLLCLTLTACDDTGITKDVYISEVMSNNVTTLSDENGDVCDWIELHNPTANPINLGGYMITDNSSNMDKFVFPDFTLKPGEYFVLFANGVEKVDAENRIIHVPLSVSTKGESLYLYNAKGKLLCRMNVLPLEDDQSFGIGEEEKLTIFDVPTPGAQNTGEVVAATTEPDENLKGKVYINEFAPNSTETLMDEEGDFVSWVEIYNTTDKTVNLRGYSLSDDSMDKEKWTFPTFKIKAGEYGVVYLSGKAKEYDGSNKIHATFKLNGTEETLCLYNKSGKTIDEVQVFELFSNLSCGRSLDDTNKFVFFTKATPGKQNSPSFVESVDSALYTGSREIAITEVAAVNTTVSQSALEEYFDYVELYNTGTEEINLASYKLSDSKKAESFKQLPDKTLAPGEYVAVYCGDSDYVSASTGNIYLDYGLNRYGETVYLMNSENVIVDTMKYGRLQSGYSAGRDVNGTNEVKYYSALTPGKANSADVLQKSLKSPEISLSSTYVEKGTTVEITVPYGEIRYTLDGSEPKKNSKLYDGAITVNKTTVLRARSFAEGYVPSDTVGSTFLVTDRRHELPVVFLTTDEKHLYDYNTGIWADGPGYTSEFPHVGANYWQNWERPVNFEYMTSDGISQVSFDAGISVFGQYSRANAQKSVEIKLKDKYGPTEVCYPFFEDNEVNVFSSLVLRNGGQDYNVAHIRDAFCAMVIKNQMDIDIMDYQPVVCYVNGKYHGIYDLREKIDEDYLANHHGIDPENVDLIKGNRDVKCGSMDNYYELTDYIKTHDLSKDEHYNYVCQYIDIDELINYWLCESFFTNTDTGNIKFWRENKEGAKWRWIFFDVDWSLFGSTYEYNVIDNYMDPDGHGVGKGFSTVITSNLIKNKNFRQRMIEIFSQQLKTTFRTERMVKILDELVAEIDSEMPYYLERWDISSYDSWKKRVETLRTIVERKRDIFIGHMKDALNMTQAEIDKYLSE
ncbi:MAG: lamin tail domain-containing protein [Clostridia bacterium]|nr:lamin tail domain-containing protein [Clostridia bacterium]